MNLNNWDGSKRRGHENRHRYHYRRGRGQDRGNYNNNYRYSWNPRRKYRPYHSNGKRGSEHYQPWNRSYRNDQQSFYNDPTLLEPPCRPPSPLPGSEEYTQRNIKQTSELIKKQLNLDGENFDQLNLSNEENDTITNVTITKSATVDADIQDDSAIQNAKKLKNSKPKAKPSIAYNVQEIHDKIIKHISKLSHSKKINLVNQGSLGYDTVMQQIQKQQRLELSRALRDMSTKDGTGSNVINSIIPDIGIKIEDLPIEVIAELSSTLDYNFDDFESFSCDLQLNDDNLLKSPNYLSSINDTQSKIEDDDTEIKPSADFVLNLNTNHSYLPNVINSIHPHMQNFCLPLDGEVIIEQPRLKVRNDLQEAPEAQSNISPITNVDKTVGCNEASLFDELKDIEVKEEAIKVTLSLRGKESPVCSPDEENKIATIPSHNSPYGPNSESLEEKHKNSKLNIANKNDITNFSDVTIDEICTNNRVELCETYRDLEKAINEPLIIDKANIVCESVSGNAENLVLQTISCNKPENISNQTSPKLDESLIESDEQKLLQTNNDTWRENEPTNNCNTDDNTLSCTNLLLLDNCDKKQDDCKLSTSLPVSPIAVAGLPRKLWRSPGEKKLLPFNLPLLNSGDNWDPNYSSNKNYVSENTSYINDTRNSRTLEDTHVACPQRKSVSSENEFTEDNHAIIPRSRSLENLVGDKLNLPNYSINTDLRQTTEELENIICQNYEDILNSCKSLIDLERKNVSDSELEQANRLRQKSVKETKARPKCKQKHKNIIKETNEKCSSKRKRKHTEDDRRNKSMEVQTEPVKFVASFEPPIKKGDDRTFTRDVIKKMREVDDEIEKLTKYRQSLYELLLVSEADKINSSSPIATPTKAVEESRSSKKVPVDIPYRLKRKRKSRRLSSNIDECIDSVVKQFSEELKDMGYPNPTGSTKSPAGDGKLNSVMIRLTRYDIKDLERIKEEIKSNSKNSSGVLESWSAEECYNAKDETVAFKDWSGSILVIKIIKDVVLAGNDKGHFYFFDLHSGKMNNFLTLDEKPITSVCTLKNGNSTTLFVGSLSGSLLLICFETQQILKRVNVENSIQCMELSWGYIFIGSHNGFLIRYDVKKDKLAESISISTSNILVIKATQEGARRVLLVATRNSPVTVRDAMTGLLMRTMETPFNPTVYTILYHNNYVYCGTSQHDVLVYDFQDGHLMFKHDQSNSSGVVCMNILRNLLFVGCYNGNIYVYNTNTHRFICSMAGPGGLFLSMEVTGNKIVSGTKQNHFQCWTLPRKVLAELT